MNAQSRTAARPLPHVRKKVLRSRCRSFPTRATSAASLRVARGPIRPPRKFVRRGVANSIKRLLLLLNCSASRFRLPVATRFAESISVILMTKEIELLFARGFQPFERCVSSASVCNCLKCFRYSSTCSSARANESSRSSCLSGDSSDCDRAAVKIDQWSPMLFKIDNVVGEPLMN